MLIDLVIGLLGRILMACLNPHSPCLHKIYAFVRTRKALSIDPVHLFGICALLYFLLSCKSPWTYIKGHTVYQLTAESL